MPKYKRITQIIALFQFIALLWLFAWILTKIPYQEEC